MPLFKRYCCLDLGEPVLKIRGGFSRHNGMQSEAEIHGIIACEGRVVLRTKHTAFNKQRPFFRRDQGPVSIVGRILDVELTRDHVVPISKGGTDVWDNVVAACKRCNHFKGSRLVENCGMELLALPYTANYPEYLVLTNSGRILGDQMNFYGKASRQRAGFTVVFI